MSDKNNVKYKKIWIAYINDSRTDGDKKYLAVKNVSGEDVLIKDGQSIFLNQVPPHIKEKYPAIPDFSKSVVIKNNEEDVADRQEKELAEKDLEDEKIEDVIPF